jgi:arsenate reductase
VITIYHKPTCSTSRKVLQMIRDAGHDPVVIDYVATGWTRAQLLGLLAAADLTPAAGLRVKGTDAAERGLPGADDETILAAMVENPVLVERPIVCGPGGVRLCRPWNWWRKPLPARLFPAPRAC